ncbi:DNA polymerase IV [Glutamicibacter sp. MNS18]|uniref:DNA polymerase IV n=1 Tax=Glutamicibacter sp. MNS18 TaxID=2989817 RepID=UPI0022358CFA|nr:DNA polymerase IV [Glutamicibacter sp. MNS18]MCW4464407.1 DNA polymerase IV [Glutamicibacter sp. MNS18]
MNAKPERAILHVDMDAFFVSVELLSRPELVGKQVIVGFPAGRSVVLSASYNCRSMGVRSAMPMSQAQALAPHAVIIEPDHRSYSRMSSLIMQYFSTITPLVEQLSIDEAFLDVTGSMRRLGGPVAIARMIKGHLASELGLPASVGVARNKFVAKLASEHAKPDGLVVVAPGRTLEFLHQLPVRALWGVGQRTLEQLHRAGIETVAQLAAFPEAAIIQRFGEHGKNLYQLAHGIDDRKVEPVRKEKSLSAEHTFDTDLWDARHLEDELVQLSHKVATRLRGSSKLAETLGIKIKYADFTTVNRSKTLPVPSDSPSQISQGVVELFRKLQPLEKAVRLVGVRVEKLADGDNGLQLSLDPMEEKTREAEKVADSIALRFPGGRLTPARLVKAPKSPSDE